MSHACEKLLSDEISQEYYIFYYFYYMYPVRRSQIFILIMFHFEENLIYIFWLKSVPGIVYSLFGIFFSDFIELEDVIFWEW